MTDNTSSERHHQLEKEVISIVEEFYALPENERSRFQALQAYGDSLYGVPLSWFKNRCPDLCIDFLMSSLEQEVLRGRRNREEQWEFMESLSPVRPPRQSIFIEMLMAVSTILPKRKGRPFK